MRAPPGYFKRIVGVLRTDAVPWARDNIVWASLVLFLPPTVAHLRQRNQPIDWALVRIAGWLYLASFGIYLAVQIVRAAWKLDQGHQATEAALAATISKKDVKIDELRADAANKTASLSFDKCQSFIIPNDGGAECFVYAGVNNTRPDTEAIISRYEFSVEIGAKWFRSSIPKHDLSDYCIANVSEELDEVTNQLVEVRGAASDLPDLAGGINYKNPVRYGLTHYGWLHFSLTGLPKWPSHTEKTEAQYWVGYPSDEEVADGWEQETRTVLTIASIKSVTLRIDPPMGTGITVLTQPFPANCCTIFRRQGMKRLDRL